MKLEAVMRNISIIEQKADLHTEICDVCYDSRKVKPGALFVAVRGYETDGHKFIASAVKNGAAAVLCEEKPAEDIPYLIVPDGRIALAEASAAFFGRPAEKLHLVGITGTNGKTTSTNLVRNILTELTAEPVGLLGTNVNITGKRTIDAVNTTPESRDIHALFAEMCEADCRYAVMEVSSHALSLDRVAGIRFEVGCFTNLSQDHLDFYGTMEKYLEAKCRLFSVCETAVVNADDTAAETVERYVTGKLLTFGIENGMLRAEDVALLPDRVRFNAVYAGEKAAVELHIPGRFSVYNALTAIGCCIAMGIELHTAAEALRFCRPVKGRMEVVPTGRDFTVLIDYAVTPDALDNMLKTVRATAGGRVVTLFGCGGDRDRTKRPKMGKVVAELSDFVIVTSDNPRTEQPEAIIEDILPGLKGIDTPYVVIPDRREAIRWGIEHAQAGDTLVLTGKGHETYQIIGKTKYHMDEREIVAEVLKG